ncbi:HAD family hydrolase [Pedobacter yulinensis]|uniref:phosphoglycolate phosphatase n=1 Tax=Pedobacter yulinensis TaxID=2126353 RepID=A0A2T3HPF4_9SPHI|nr:HAD family hydrolase [Pedobacter yulinensis]PST84340.1 HAD family hydrolase [Pedobacter yulinensis]
MPQQSHLTADSLIFDLDGTLWDAAETCASAWNETFRQQQLDQHSLDATMVRSVSGLQIERVFDQYFSFVPADRRKTVFTAYQENEKRYMRAHGGILFPEVREVLPILKANFRLFIVSNCLAGYIENFLDFHGLEIYFDDFECPGRTGLPKSENIAAIIARNGLKAPVYIGDTIWDYEATAANNIPFIHAAYGFAEVPDASYRIGKFSDLPGLVRPL